MSKSIIYLIGFPGSGKLTTAWELCKMINAVIVSSKLLNNFMFNLVEFENSEVPESLWEKIFEVRKNILEVLEKYYIKSKHYIFTNELLEGDSYDQKVYNLVVELSNKIGVKIFPVVLNCNNEELAKRVQSEERRKDRRITDPTFAMKRIKGKRLFVPAGALEIDNSSLSAKEVAEKIVEEMKNRKLAPIMKDNSEVYEVKRKESTNL